jgi:hypothetical protein
MMIRWDHLALAASGLALAVSLGMCSPTQSQGPPGLSVFGAVTAGNCVKFQTASQIADSGGVCLTGTGVRTQSTPANPASTTNLTGVMAGLAGSITPVLTGRIFLSISGSAFNNTNNDGCTITPRYGTGTAPTNGAALAGTVAGNSNGLNTSNGSNDFGAWTAQGLVTGLTLNTAYWLDVGQAIVTGGTCSLLNITVIAIEL